MDSKITKFIIVCDNLIATKNMTRILCDLLRKNGKQPEGHIKPGCCNINANGISIFVYLKTYRYLDLPPCDYFGISVTDMDSYLEWEYHLKSRGKELTTFHALKEEITMACSLTNDSINYINNDIASFYSLYEQYRLGKDGNSRKLRVDNDSKTNTIQIQNVIFNDPATIVLWNDGTKTVVKAKNEDFDPEKGLAMAIAKKALGNKGNYYDIFKKWLPNITATSKDDTEKMCNIGNSIKYGFSNGIKIADAIDRVSEFLNSSTTAYDDEEKNNG